MEELLRAGGEADARLPLSGYSALELLAEYVPCADSAACGAALLRAGARPACTKVKSCSCRAVDVAGKKGNAALFGALLEAGASPAPIALNMRAGDHMQSLNYLSLACERGHAGVLRLALAAGCSPNTRCCQWGAPPLLCLALYFGHEACASLLLAQPGIEVNVVYPVKGKSRNGVVIGAMIQQPEGEVPIEYPMGGLVGEDLCALSIAMGSNQRQVAQPRMVAALLALGAKTAQELGGRGHFTLTFGSLSK